MESVSRLLVVASLWLTPVGLPDARSDDAPAPATSVQELQRRLAAPVSVSWSGAAFREAIATRSRASGVAVFFDRRLDPGAALELVAAEEPLESVLRRAAETQGGAITTLGAVVYVGTADTVARLRTVAELRRKQFAVTAEMQQALARTAPLAWPDLAEPRSLVEQLTQEARLRVSNPEQVPHDLWPAAALPPTPLVERLTLLLAPFDLTFRIDAASRTLTLVPLDESPKLERRYAVAGPPAATIDRWRKLAPAATFRAEAGAVFVSGRVEDHERLAVGKITPAAPGKPAAPAAGEKRYTLRLKNKPFGELVRLLRDGHKLPIEVDEQAVQAAGISLETLTSVEVVEATLEQLLEQAGAPLGLAVQAADGKLRIVPKR